MMKKGRSIKKLPSELMSVKIFRLLFDDFSFFGSIPFYLFLLLLFFFIGNMDLFFRLLYTFLLSIIVILVIKNVHYKDRPQKEEFTIFMEKVIASSFPSTHSLFVTTIAILVSFAYPVAWVIITSCILSILVYIHRYISRKHFFVDIVGGILIGIVEIIFVIKVM